MPNECPFCKINGVEQNMKKISDADSILGEMWKCMNHG